MGLQEFILKHVESVDHLRALLLLRTEVSRLWSITEVSSRLYLEPKRIAAVLAALQGAGVLRAVKGEYQYHPETPGLARLVEELEVLDRERPVTLIKLIYSRPDTLEAFADAFKLRRDD